MRNVGGHVSYFGWFPGPEAMEGELPAHLESRH